jgi:hypothetical protein
MGHVDGLEHRGVVKDETVNQVFGKRPHGQTNKESGACCDGLRRVGLYQSHAQPQQNQGRVKGKIQKEGPSRHIRGEKMNKPRLKAKAGPGDPAHRCSARIHFDSPFVVQTRSQDQLKA